MTIKNISLEKKVRPTKNKLKAIKKGTELEIQFPFILGCYFLKPN